MINALWVQCGILILLIVVPLVGVGSIDILFELLTNSSALSLVIPYVVLVGSYFVFKSKCTALFVSCFVFLIGVAGFIGAVWSEISEAGSFSDVLEPILRNYGGPIALIIGGIIVTRITTYYHNKNKSPSLNSILDSMSILTFPFTQYKISAILLCSIFFITFIDIF
ncbi:MAG: hypothetical protein ACRC03_08865 [Romboutsia sp.]